MNRFQHIVVTGLMLAAPLHSVAAEPPLLKSPWVGESHARARLIAGGPASDAPAGTLAVGIEIELADGWKTYWRNPGSSGVPPIFDWVASSNVASVHVRYPAPSRMADRAGDTIGYKKRVILPVAVSPRDAGRNVLLNVEVEYGVCKDICIPLQSRLELMVPPDASKARIANDLARAFDRVPRSPAQRRPSDPELSAAKIALDGDKPAIRLDATFPGGAENADIFVDVSDGAWIPMAKREGASRGNAATFIIDLADGADIAELRGKTARVTLVSPAGQSEATLKIE